MSEQTPNALKVIVVILGAVAVGTIMFVFAKMQASPVKVGEESAETPITEEVAEVPPPEAPGDVSTGVSSGEGTGNTEDAVAEPAPISGEIQAKINAITARVDRGEMTLEDAQREINKLLGL
jgi:hypothetical protein